MFETISAWISVSILVGLLYAPVTLGLAWSFRYINYPDLTCEGTFIISGAISMLVLNITNCLFLSITAGIISGFLAGAFTGFIHLYLKVSRLLSGIITWSILYSLSIRIMSGLANIPAKTRTLFQILNPQEDRLFEFMYVSLILIIIFLVFLCFAYSRIGRLNRVLGDQYTYPISLGYSPKPLMIIGLMFSNSMYAICGIIVSQYRQVFDINMGSGVLIAGLASLVLGESLFASKKIWQHSLLVIIGSIVYNLAIGAFYFDWGVEYLKYLISSDVRLIGGVLILCSAVIVARKSLRYKMFSSEW